MSKVNNSNNQVETVNNRNKHPQWKLHPLLLKGITSVILAGFSLVIKYQLPRFVITISTDVCQTHQKDKIFIKVDFSAKEFTDLEK
ncbi:MAG: hypothetical protein WBG73_02590 [Coleofasciculaceae cyanobacterium]